MLPVVMVTRAQLCSPRPPEQTPLPPRRDSAPRGKPILKLLDFRAWYKVRFSKMEEKPHLLCVNQQS